MQKRNNKIPLWLPYTTSITVKKTKVSFVYKGGEYADDLNNILSIMFYGSICDLQESFLQACSTYRIPVCFHRRNMPTALWITPSTTTSKKEDVLTKQILFKHSGKKGAHIARKLLHAKFQSMEWLVAYPSTFRKKYYSLEEMRNIEATHAKVYWKKYFDRLQVSGYTRRGEQYAVKGT